MNPSVYRVSALVACAAALVAGACNTVSSSQLPIGFTAKLSHNTVNTPIGAPGVDTLFIAAVGNFGGQVTVAADASYNCSVTPSTVNPFGAAPVESVVQCMLQTPGTAGILLTASSPGYQNAFATLYVMQH